jgi:hypothetical protein
VALGHLQGFTRGGARRDAVLAGVSDERGLARREHDQADNRCEGTEQRGLAEAQWLAPQSSGYTGNVTGRAGDGDLPAPQALEIDDRDAEVLDAQQRRLLEDMQRVIDALAGQARKVPDLFLRDLQMAVGARVELRVEKRSQALRHA